MFGAPAATDAPCQIYTGLIPHVWWPWNVSDRKKQLAANAMATNLSATSCAGLDPNLLAQWSLFYASAYTWATSSTIWFGVGGQADQLQSYECALYNWQRALSQAKCQIVVQDNPNPPGPDSIGDLANAAKWVGVAVASVAGAWALGKGLEVAGVALELLPRPSRGRVKP
jgi:hypothetical protein